MSYLHFTPHSKSVYDLTAVCLMPDAISSIVQILAADIFYYISLHSFIFNTDVRGVMAVIYFML